MSENETNEMNALRRRELLRTVISNLNDARRLLLRADSPSLLADVRKLLKRAENAQRHADNLAVRHRSKVLAELKAAQPSR